MNQHRLSSKPTGWIRLACLMLITFMTTTSARAVFADNDSDEIDNFVEAQMRELHIPALALAIVQGDQILYLKGYGIADASGRPVTADTLFIMGANCISLCRTSPNKPGAQKGAQNILALPFYKMVLVTLRG